MDKEKCDIAVLGATGLVGEALVRQLEERDFPVGELFALASERSLGRSVEFRGRELPVRDAADFDFSRVQLALFAAGAQVAGELAPRAVAAGCLVIDHSTRFRADAEVPLVIPAINAAALAGLRPGGIVASPGAASIALLAVLAPLHAAAGVQRVDLTLLNSASVDGRAAVEALAHETVELLNGREPRSRPAHPRQAFNCIPSGAGMDGGGSTAEERGMPAEVRRLLGADAPLLNVTEVRVPTFFGCSQVLHVRLRQALTAADARALLAASGGIHVQDQPETGRPPTVIGEAANQDTVYVGRIREDNDQGHGLNLWVVSDNVRAGAASNGVRIAGILVHEYL